MIRKPKYHPKYGTRLVGINFRERWNVVETATKDEIELYIKNSNHVKQKRRERTTSSWWEHKSEIINEKVQNIHLRKVWRKRFSESFEQEKIYVLDKTLRRWNVKLGPTSGDGLAVSYNFQRETRLMKGDMVVLTKTDELGNLYFSKINEIAAPHPYVFNRDNGNLGWIVPVET